MLHCAPTQPCWRLSRARRLEHHPDLIPQRDLCNSKPGRSAFHLAGNRQTVTPRRSFTEVSPGHVRPCVKDCEWRALPLRYHTILQPPQPRLQYLERVRVPLDQVRPCFPLPKSLKTTLASHWLRKTWTPNGAMHLRRRVKRKRIPSTQGMKNLLACQSVFPPLSSQHWTTL